MRYQTRNPNLTPDWSDKLQAKLNKHAGQRVFLGGGGMDVQIIDPYKDKGAGVRLLRGDWGFFIAAAGGKPIRWATDKPKVFEKKGFKRSKLVLMEINGNDIPDEKYEPDAGLVRQTTGKTK
jgi:hypothetical protein